MISAYDIMSEHVVVIHEDVLVQQAAHLMLRDRISGLPVADRDNNALIGIVTITDLFKMINKAAKHNNAEEFYTQLPKFKKMQVSEVMSREVVTIKPQTKFPEIIQILLDKNIHTFPVIDDSGKLVGIVSRHDILNAAFTFE